MTWVCSDIVQIQRLLGAIKTFRHTLLQNMKTEGSVVRGGGDISVIRQYKNEMMKQLPHITLQQQQQPPPPRSHYHMSLKPSAAAHL